MEEYTTASGYTVRIKGVSVYVFRNIARDVAKRMPVTPVPTYVVETDLGDTEEHQYDAILAKEEGGAAWEQWQQHMSSLKAYQDEVNRLVTRALFFKGIDFDMPVDEEWVEELQFLGMEVPADKMERRIYYLETVVFGSATDIKNILMRVMELGGMPSSAASGMDAIFRGNVEGATGNGWAAATG